MSNSTGTYDLSPSKQTYESLKSDVTPFSAVKELIDNVLDNWRRTEEEDPDLTIDIKFDFERGEFRIEDNSGGIEDENIAKLFALGQSFKSEIPWSIGAFGMGAKKAIIRLGKEATIKSRTQSADMGYGFTVDEEWLNHDNWEIEREEFNGIDKGSTVIEVSGLNIELGDAAKEEQSEEAIEDGRELEFSTEEEFVKVLRENLSETYGEFLLNSAGPEDGELEIVVNGTAVEHPEQPNWSYTPFDGYHPRYFKSYKISADELPNHSTSVSVDVIAGLLREGSQEKAGTDIIIQNRKILSASGDETGGWGSYLPNFGPQKRRTKFIVRIKTEENPENLPWDTQKSHIDTNNIIADRVYNFLKRAGEGYASVDYGDIQAAVLSPYDGENEASWGESPEQIDYSDRKIVIHKPNDDLSEISALSSLVKKHQDIGAFYPSALDDQYQPAYRAQYNSSRTGDRELTSEEATLISIESEEYPENQIRFILSWIQDLAQRHEEQTERIDFPDRKPWWYNYYRDQFQDWDACDPVIEIPDPQEHIESAKSAEGLPDSILPDELAGESVDEESEDEEEHSSTDEENDESTEETESPGEQQNEEEGEDEDEEEDVQSNQGEGDETDEKTDGMFEDDDDVGGTEGLVLGGDDDTRPILLHIPSDDYEQICEEINVDPTEAEPHQVGHRILEEGIEIGEFIEDPVMPAEND